MTDLEDFQAFFRKHGVACSTHPHFRVDGSRVDDEHGALTTIYCSQACFKFGDRGEYLGVLDDEMGNWTPKEAER
jgi:hypothetical protein